MNDRERERLWFALGSAFSPSAPVDVMDLFAGRRRQIHRLLDAVSQKGQHAVVYGERGVGKTSLLRVLSAFLPGESVVAHVNCDATDTYDSLWRKALAKIPVTWEEETAGIVPRRLKHEGSVADELGDAPLVPDTVLRVLERHGRGTTLVIVLDEFDCFPDAAGRRLVAQTVKTLSDFAAPATVVIVGVADDVGSLLEGHASVERALAQILMPRMSSGELEEVLTKSLARVAMRIEPAAVGRITHLSQGLPHYTHLIGQATARRAVRAGLKVVADAHVEPAVGDALENAQQTVKAAYHKATTSPRKDNLFGDVLLACALARGDDQGYFAAADVREPMKRVTGRDYDIPNYSKHLHGFCEDKRGPALKRFGEKHGHRFRFANPLLQPYVIMKGISAGKVALDGA